MNSGEPNGIGKPTRREALSGNVRLVLPSVQESFAGIDEEADEVLEIKQAQTLSQSQAKPSPGRFWPCISEDGVVGERTKGEFLKNVLFS